MTKWILLILAVAFFTFGIVERANHATMSRKAAIHLQGYTKDTTVMFYSGRMP